MSWHTRRRGRGRQPGTRFETDAQEETLEDIAQKERQRRILQLPRQRRERLLTMGPSTFYKAFKDAVLNTAGDLIENRKWVQLNWERLYNEYLHSGLGFDEWFEKTYTRMS